MMKGMIPIKNKSNPNQIGLNRPNIVDPIIGPTICENESREEEIPIISPLRVLTDFAKYPFITPLSQDAAKDIMIIMIINE